MQFVRTSLDDGSQETLTIVECPSVFYCQYVDDTTPYLVQVTSGDEFVGLFDLDGDEIAARPKNWWIPSAIPVEVIKAVEEGWDNTTSRVERRKI